MSGQGFFDVHRRLKGRSPRETEVARRMPRPGERAPQPLTITQLTAMIEKAVRSGVPATICAKGEVSNASLHPGSGHLYFTLKDSSACIGCVMWREAAAALPFRLQDGMEMVATGSVAVYGPQGKYQLRVNALQPVGHGALELACRQLRAKLEAEGLFSPSRKKPIPSYPLRIAIVTGRSTAAVQDIFKVFAALPWLKLMLYHVPVQGEGCGAKIAQAIEHLNRQAPSIGGVDVLILARGGGSLEDLWGFNDEALARAIAASRIPVVTGIGHEIDCSIADLVADYHAHTPTEAAQVVAKHWKQAMPALANLHLRLGRSLEQVVHGARLRLLHIQRHELFRRPLDRINIRRQMLDERQQALSLGFSKRLRNAEQRLGQIGTQLQAQHPGHLICLLTQRLGLQERRLAHLMRSSVANRFGHLKSLQRQLEAISPQAVLARGYTITTHKKTGQILRRASEIKPGDRLLTRFADGEAESIAEDPQQPSLF